MVQRLSFHDEIRRNKIKSFVMIVVIFIAFIVLGAVISLAVDPGFFFVIMIFSTIFSLAYILISYYNSDKIAIASVRAKKASRTEHRMFYHAAEAMSISSGLPMPKLYVMESSQINAFASGRDPKNAVICVTTGCLKKLNKQELEGVIAHEMSHIANYDIRYMTIVAVMVGLISIVSQLFLRSLWFSGRGGDRDNGRAQVVLMIVAIVLAIVAPIVVQLVSLAVSRKREFAADATGVKFTRYPPGLKSALEKIRSEHMSIEDKKKFPSAVAPLFISYPFKKKISGLFATHPAIDERIKKLERM
ncbi:MAG: M48 family metallopeptidase [Nanoarchaeota archaeon]|nr:M48 family metallopeptidase [Nanoarchaeota archaeon]